MTRDPLDLFHARTGIVCLVGAGGKKTTLYRLARAHPGRIGITASVHVTLFPPDLGAAEIIADAAEVAAAVRTAAAGRARVAFAAPSGKRGRHGGFDVELIERIHAEVGFETTFVKADGARTRHIKAPRPDEPKVPAGTSTLIPVVSARVFGEPLTERVAHRVDLVSAVTGVAPGEPLTPEHVARLLAHEHGSLQRAGHARVVPLINMVDDADREGPARRAARRALELTDRFDRVVLACMRREDPIVAVVER